MTKKFKENIKNELKNILGSEKEIDKIVLFVSNITELHDDES